jgi:hypothetical protein
MEEGECQTHAAMSNKFIATMGVDIGKNPFHVVAQIDAARSCCAQMVRRSDRTHRNARPCLIGMEAAVGAHRACKPTVTREGLRALSMMAHSPTRSSSQAG